MMTFQRRLQALDPAESVIGPMTQAVVLLTGRSLYDNCHLPPQQLTFLQRVAPPGVTVVNAAFPYHPRLMTDCVPEPNLLICSWRNGAQYVWTRISPSFRQSLARHLQAIFAHCERVAIITGSCGLAFLEAALPYLNIRPELHQKVIALGPVTWRPPTMRDVTIVRGASDWISRCVAPVQPDFVVPGGHLDYYTNPAVERLTRTLCERYFAP